MIDNYIVSLRAILEVVVTAVAITVSVLPLSAAVLRLSGGQETAGIGCPYGANRSAPHGERRGGPCFDEALTEFDLAVRRYREADAMHAAGWRWPNAATYCDFAVTSPARWRRMTRR